MMYIVSWGLPAAGSRLRQSGTLPPVAVKGIGPRHAISSTISKSVEE